MSHRVIGCPITHGLVVSGRAMKPMARPAARSFDRSIAGSLTFARSLERSIVEPAPARHSYLKSPTRQFILEFNVGCICFYARWHISDYAHINNGAHSHQSMVLHMIWEGGWDYERIIFDACGLGT